MTDNIETITKASNLWDSASIFSEQQQRSWAQAERLLNAGHLTDRKPGRSAIFVPKIPGYHRRKLADFVSQFDGDTPITVKDTLTSSSIGAKIRQKVHNHYIKTSVSTPYESIIYDAAYCGLAYNYAPAHLSWEETRAEEEVEVIAQGPDGSVSKETQKHETITDSYLSVETIPPEDFLVDDSITWADLDDSRYIGFRKFVDQNDANEL